MSQIRIDAPGAGEWIMEQCEARFDSNRMRVFSTHTIDSKLLGGFVVMDYFSRASVSVNMAGDKPGWCTRYLLWAVFEYCFHDTTAKKVFAVIRSDNYRSLELCLRAGFRVETVVRDVYAEGVHAVVLYMTEATCVWLRHRPKTSVFIRDNVVVFGQPDRDAA